MPLTLKIETLHRHLFHMVPPPPWTTIPKFNIIVLLKSGSYNKAQLYAYTVKTLVLN